MMGAPRFNPELPLLERPTNDKYVLAAQITGAPKSANVPMSDKPAEDAANDDAKSDDKAETPPAKAAEAKSEPAINVVLVGDIDCLYSAFFNLRARGEDAEDDVEFRFDNVPFVLNVLDKLAGDERFIEIRTRRPSHRVLKKVNEATEKAREDADHEREKFRKRYEQTVAQVRKEFQEKVDKWEKAGGSQQQTIQMLQRASMPSGSSTSSWRNSSPTATRRSRSPSRPWPAKSAACRTIASCGRCCCRRSSRRWWRSSCFSIAVPANARACRRLACGRPFPIIDGPAALSRGLMKTV